MATAKIRAGMADCIIAGGAESMSMIPMGGWKLAPNLDIAKNHPDWYWGMGITAEAVANEYNISREDQDAFALQSHLKACAAIDGGKFTSEVVPVTVSETYLDEKGKRKTRTQEFLRDEGPRQDTDAAALAKLKPVFAQGGSVTAGNSSQTSDGAA